MLQISDLSWDEKECENIIKDLSPIIDGSGGGQPFFATGGGKNIEAIDKALAEAEKIINLL